MDFDVAEAIAEPVSLLGYRNGVRGGLQQGEYHNIDARSIEMWRTELSVDAPVP